MKKGYTKGVELGMQHGYDLCLESVRNMIDSNTDMNLIIPELVRRKSILTTEQ